MIRSRIVLSYVFFSLCFVVFWYFATGAHQTSLPLSISSLGSLRVQIAELFSSPPEIKWEFSSDVTPSQHFSPPKNEPGGFSINVSSGEVTNGESFEVILATESVRVLISPRFDHDDYLSLRQDLDSLLLGSGCTFESFPVLSERYRLSYTLVNSDPSRVLSPLPLSPLFPLLEEVQSRLSSVFSFTFDSEVFSYGTLPASSSSSSERFYDEESLSRLLSVNPWWSFESVDDPVSHSLHFLLFVPSSRQCPVLIRLSEVNSKKEFEEEEEEVRDPSFVVSGWGGVIFANRMCEGEDEERETIDESLIGDLLGQLRWILGLRTPTQSNFRIVAPSSSTEIFAKWEIYILARRFAKAYAERAIELLVALMSVVDSMERLAIGEEVREEVSNSLLALDGMKEYVRRGELEEAARFARQAMGAAKRAFEHPSMSAEQYFPLSQKMGVYMPVVMPLIVHVARLLAAEVKRWKRRRTTSSGS